MSVVVWIENERIMTGWVRMMIVMRVEIGIEGVVGGRDGIYGNEVE